MCEARMMAESMRWQTEMKKLSPGVYAYIQSEGTWFISNAGLILGDDRGIVIDSLATGKMVRNFIDEIENLTNNQIDFLINTHFHGDHIYTNHFFSDAITICDSTTRKLTEESSTEEIELYSELWPEIDFSESKITTQDITFEEEMTINLSNKRVRIISVGRAHTASDSFVYLPEEKIVFCGDLLFYRSTPFALMGSISSYIEVMEQLIELEADTYVPGHGPVSGEEALKESQEYLKLVRGEAKKRFEEGMGYFEAAKDIDLGNYENWANSERIVGNVARAYNEFKKERDSKELDYRKIFLRMMEY